MKDPKPDELLAGEKVGLLRSLAIVKNELDTPTLELFQTRLEEGYDLEGEDNDCGRLWRIFRNINKFLSMQKRPNDEDGMNDEQLSASNDDEDKDDSAVSETERENEEDVSHVTDGNSTATRTKPSAPLYNYSFPSLHLCFLFRSAGESICPFQSSPSSSSNIKQ